MSFVKNNLKWILGIIVGVVIASGISVYATGQYFASQVNYTTDKNGEISNVEQALNDLYQKRNKVTKYSLNASTTNAGSTYNFDISNYENYNNITIDNIYVQFTRNSWRYMQQSDACGRCEYTYSYNPENGIITVTLGGSSKHETWADPKTTADIIIIE